MSASSLLGRGASRFFDFITLLILIGSFSPLSLVLFNINPSAGWMGVLLWLAGYSCDLYTTWLFYRENHRGFLSKERNPIFGRLANEFGFRASAVAFTLILEIPVLLLLAFAILPYVAKYLFPSPCNPLACLFAGFAVLGVAHLQASYITVRETCHARRLKTAQNPSS